MKPLLGLSCLLPLGLAASAFAQAPIVPLRDGRLLPSDAAQLDGAGTDVSISGDTAVIGSPGATHGGLTQAGAAYVFVRTPAGWVEQAKLVAGDAAAGDAFGASVSIDGDRIAVGALRASVGGFFAAGAVYVFERTGSSWLQTDKLVGTGADHGEGVGWSLDLEGDRLVAGAVDDHHSGGLFDGGAAYVFSRGPGGWTQEARLISGGGEAFDYFGHDVDLDGERIVVGAYSDNHVTAANGGSAHVYQLLGSNWTKTQTIVPADNGSNDQFGWSVALDDATLAVGAIGVTVSGAFSAGSAYVFELGPAGFVQTQKILPATPGQYEHLGSSVALDDELLIVGSMAGENVTGPLSGAAFVHRRTAGGTYALELALRATEIESGADFGFSVALEDGLALIGAPRDDTSGSGFKSGSAYAYRLEPAVSTYCTAKVNGLGCTPSIGSSGVPSLSSASPFLVEAFNVLNQRNGLLFYGFAPSAAPFQGGTRCVSSPLRRTGVQDSGGSASGDDCTGTYAFDFNAWMQSGADPEITAGTEVFAQYWSRDPFASFGSGLTDGIGFFALP